MDLKGVQLLGSSYKEKVCFNVPTLSRNVNILMFTFSEISNTNLNEIPFEICINNR